VFVAVSFNVWHDIPSKGHILLLEVIPFAISFSRLFLISSSPTKNLSFTPIKGMLFPE
jgi:hypothetical protein